MAGNKTWGLLGFAVILAVIAAWASVSYLDTREANLRAQLERENEKIEVIVAAYDLSPGETINSSNLVLRDVPVDYIPDGAIMPEEFDMVDGMQLSVPMTSGRPLIRNNIVGVNGVEKFSELLKKGERSITLKIDEIQSNQGMLKAGDYIDIILKLSLSNKEGNEEESSKNSGNNFLLSEIYNVVLERAVVLATGDKTISEEGRFDIEKDPYLVDEYETITLGVKVKDVPKVLAAVKYKDSGVGDMLFLLRNPEDEDKARYKSIQQMQENIIQTYAGGKATGGRLTINYASSENGTVNALFNGDGSNRKFRKYKSAPLKFVKSSEKNDSNNIDANYSLIEKNKAGTEKRMEMKIKTQKFRIK